MRLRTELPNTPFKVRMPAGGIPRAELGKILPDCDWKEDALVYAVYCEYSDYSKRYRWSYLEVSPFGGITAKNFFTRMDNYQIVGFDDVFTTTKYKDE